MAKYKLVLSPVAFRQYKRLRAGVRALLKQAMRERLMEQDPTREDRNRFRLRRASPHADYELRAQEWRLFYRVDGKTVIVELIGKKDGDRLLIEREEFIL